MIGILIGWVWVSYDILAWFSIAVIGCCFCSLQYHSVNVGMINIMLLVGTSLVVTRWRTLIHSWVSWRFHGWRRCGPHIFPLFNRWRSRFKKYCAGGMTCAAWLIFPINYSSVSVLIFAEANESLMSLNQAVCFSFGRNTLKEWMFMSHPRQVFCLTSLLSPASFLKESGSSHFSGSDACSGHNSVWMTNRATPFSQSIQFS